LKAYRPLFLFFFTVAPLITSLSCKNNASATVSESPIFSANSGYYSQAFSLTLSAGDGESIYYTLDGSEPTEGSSLYSSPLTISAQELDCDAESPVDLYSLQGNSSGPMTFVYSAPLPAGAYPASAYYGYNYYSPRNPSGSIPRATVVRVRVYKDGLAQGPVETRTYWVGDDPAKGLLPVVSLAIAPANFVGWSAGIYVPGKSFDSAQIQTGNYYNGWERPANFSLFDSTNALQYQADVGLRVAGQNPQMPLKPLRIFSRGEYGSSWMNYSFFPGSSVSAYKRLNLRAGGFPEFAYGYFTDDIAQNLLEDSDIDMQRARPVALYVNGEFWGLHSLKERLDEYYLQTKYGLSDAERDDLDYFNDGEYDAGDSNAWNAFLALQDGLAADGDISDADCAEISQYADLDNAYNVLSSQIYYSNMDWPYAWNDRRWRLRSGGSSQSGVRDGKWRWMIFDLDAAFGGKWLNDSVDYWKPQWLTLNDPYAAPHNMPTDRLLQNPNQCAVFLTAFCNLLNSNFKETRVEASIDAYYAQVEPFMALHVQRWGYPDSVETWKGRFDAMRSFAQERPSKVRALALNYFKNTVAIFPGLGDPVDLTLAVSGSGTVRVGDMAINSSTPGVSASVYPWSGIYYSNMAIKLSAVPIISQDRLRHKEA
jgi:hypothetical protein